LYADAGKWLRKGWCDYFAPQLYWKVEQTAQSYPVLLKWWTEQNPKGRHIWVGNYTSQVMARAWTEEEVRNQIRLTREQKCATGSVHFSGKSLRPGMAAGQWAATVYSRPALVPASPWLDDESPAAPNGQVQADAGGSRLAWTAGSAEKPWLWVVQLR